MRLELEVPLMLIVVKRAALARRPSKGVRLGFVIRTKCTVLYIQSTYVHTYELVTDGSRRESQIPRVFDGIKPLPVKAMWFKRVVCRSRDVPCLSTPFFAAE